MNTAVGNYARGVQEMRPSGDPAGKSNFPHLSNTTSKFVALEVHRALSEPRFQLPLGPVDKNKRSAKFTTSPTISKYGPEVSITGPADGYLSKRFGLDQAPKPRLEPQFDSTQTDPVFFDFKVAEEEEADKAYNQMLLNSMGYSSDTLANVDLKQFTAPPPPSHIPAPITRLAKEINSQSADLPLSQYPRYDEIFLIDPVTYEAVLDNRFDGIDGDKKTAKKASGMTTVSKSDLARMLDEQRQMAVQRTVDVIGKAASDGVVWSPSKNSTGNSSLQQSTNNRSIVQELRSFRD
jgi:hypothetical protein